MWVTMPARGTSAKVLPGAGDVRIRRKAALPGVTRQSGVLAALVAAASRSHGSDRSGAGLRRRRPVRPGHATRPVPSDPARYDPPHGAGAYCRKRRAVPRQAGRRRAGRTPHGACRREHAGRCCRSRTRCREGAAQVCGVAPAPDTWRPHEARARGERSAASWRVTPCACSRGADCVGRDRPALIQLEAGSPVRRIMARRSQRSGTPTWMSREQETCMSPSDATGARPANPSYRAPLVQTGYGISTPTGAPRTICRSDGSNSWTTRSCGSPSTSRTSRMGLRKAAFQAARFSTTVVSTMSAGS